MYPLENLGDNLARISKWIDEAPANAARDREAATWGRIAKVTEECGEVVSAYIGVTGQNPRKGVHGQVVDVAEELLDVAVTALAAYEHLTGNHGTVKMALHYQIEAIMKRAGL